MKSAPRVVSNPAKPAGGLGLTVLLAEDDATSRCILTGLLEKIGCEVFAVCDGLEAVQFLAETAVDVVMMDIQMPVMDGLEATRRIRSDGSLGRGAKVPIVAVTAYAMRGDREKFLEAGMDDYLSKPVDIHSLMGTLERVLEREEFRDCP
jgi:CheY-like chemotaxis protein